MLRVTVEIFPGGRESSRRVLATADLTRVKSGSLADYEIVLRDDVLGEIGAGRLNQYPRFAASIWDLVARGISIALAGREELPLRPQLPNVPVHNSGTLPYVRFREIPEPARTLFRRNMRASTVPVIDEDPMPTDCAYAWDWVAFLNGSR